jgi:hypothetical protein
MPDYDAKQKSGKVPEQSLTLEAQRMTNVRIMMLVVSQGEVNSLPGSVRKYLEDITVEQSSKDCHFVNGCRGLIL